MSELPVSRKLESEASIDARHDFIQDLVARVAQIAVDANQLDESGRRTIGNNCFDAAVHLGTTNNRIEKG